MRIVRLPSPAVTAFTQRRKAGAVSCAWAIATNNTPNRLIVAFINHFGAHALELAGGSPHCRVCEHRENLTRFSEYVAVGSQRLPHYPHPEIARAHGRSFIHPRERFFRRAIRPLDAVVLRILLAVAE